MKGRGWVWLVIIAITVLVWRWWPTGRSDELNVERKGEDYALAVGRVWAVLGRKIDPPPDVDTLDGMLLRTADQGIDRRGREGFGLAHEPV